MFEMALKVTVGDSVTFHLSVTNAGDTSIELTFRDACQADFTVYDGPTEVWRYSDRKAFTQTLTKADFHPGETATFEQRWPDPIEGAFTAEATLRVREGECRTRTPFSV